MFCIPQSVLFHAGNVSLFPAENSYVEDDYGPSNCGDVGALFLSRLILCVTQLRVEIPVGAINRRTRLSLVKVFQATVLVMHLSLGVEDAARSS